jgi:hypothetical protein
VILEGTLVAISFAAIAFGTFEPLRAGLRTFGRRVGGRGQVVVIVRGRRLIFGSSVGRSFAVFTSVRWMNRCRRTWRTGSGSSTTLSVAQFAGTCSRIRFDGGTRSFRSVTFRSLQFGFGSGRITEARRSPIVFGAVQQCAHVRFTAPSHVDDKHSCKFDRKLNLCVCVKFS